MYAFHFSQPIPGNHSPTQLSEHVFVAIDVNPTDGIVTEAEWDNLTRNPTLTVRSIPN